jgi:hypothetical protein
MAMTPSVKRALVMHSIFYKIPCNVDFHVCMKLQYMSIDLKSNYAPIIEPYY